jgi:hypothetical protein
MTHQTTHRAQASDDAPRSSPSAVPARKTYPLLGAFPLAVMTLAAVVVLFAFAMAALNAKADSDLRASTATTHLVPEGLLARNHHGHQG